MKSMKKEAKKAKKKVRTMPEDRVALLRDIYIVVCHSLAGDEDSAAAFEEWDDAIDYVLNEELAERAATKKEMREAKAELYEQRSTVYGDWEYTVYDAKLVTG